MRTEVLNLKQGAASESPCAVHPILDEVIRSFKTMFANAEPGPDHAALDAQITAHTQAVLGAHGRTALTQTGRTLITSCQTAAGVITRRQEARRHDIAALVRIVRETVESLVVGHAAAAEALGDSATRLDNLQHVSNFSELKHLLAAEVVTLRQIASDREEEHDQVVAALKTRLTTAEEQLSLARTEALTDPLTEIANRRSFDMALEQRLRDADPDSAVVLALFDVDSFKAINDRLGHSSGDAVLRHVATRMRESVRHEDFVARIGGDEFALIATGLTLRQAESRLRGLIQMIAGEPVGPEAAVVSLSCGASEYSAGDTAQTFQQRADAALSDAKALGKNRVSTRAVPSIRRLLRLGR